MKPIRNLLADVWAHERAAGTWLFYPVAVLMVLPFALAAWAMGELE